MTNPRFGPHRSLTSLPGVMIIGEGITASRRYFIFLYLPPVWIATHLAGEGRYIYRCTVISRISNCTLLTVPIDY